MAAFNKVILAGNLVRDVELKYTPGGTAVAEFSLAVNRKWYDKSSNQQKEETAFVGVVVFGKAAENVAKYCQKGSNLLVEGHLKTDSWKDKQTQQNRSKLTVVCDSFQFLSKSGGGQRSDSQPRSEMSQPSEGGGYADDSDVPF